MIERISLCGVPVDILKPENLEQDILEILIKPGTKQIMFLSVWNLLKARSNSEYMECLKNADLIIPVSKSIIKGAKFLKKNVPVRYNPFDAVISILSVLESHYKSVYLLGSAKKTLLKAESNLHDTYPNLHIVGRCVGYFSKNAERDVVQAIYKSQASLVLVSEGIKEKDLWAYRRRNSFSSSIFLYFRDAFGIFSDRIRRVDPKTFEKGHEVFVEIAHNPFKVFLVFPYMWYNLVLFWYKIRKK
ncbi:MAG: WecB/TagA/CpsF family glycosyltransferase [Treponema sp.]|nr:WecB/TagA/CpsF family glycosyltransferase [Treponema sp.]